ncbi:hypothetical protein PMI12_02603 [Variovorax sp. CF313]|nr:hypothetical protein PMI12_02603 [Variovorax sp. CF313]
MRTQTDIESNALQGMRGIRGMPGGYLICTTTLPFARPLST